MDPMRDDRERDRLESTWDRWRGLPLGYRINACLYVLAFIALVGLLAQVVSGGGKPRRVDVASRAPTTTRPNPTTTAPTGTLPLATAPTTTATAQPATPTAPSGPGPSAPARPSGGGRTSQPTDTTPIPGLPLPPGNCLNSSDPACGDFSWSPPAGDNLPITITVDRSPSVVTPGQQVQFTVVVGDGDHQVSDNCAVVNFGDGTSVQPPCQPLICPPTFGPWTPPARVAGSMTFRYSHAYTAAGTYNPTFEFHTDRDRCPDPYGNYGNNSTTVTVN